MANKIRVPKGKRPIGGPSMGKPAPNLPGKFGIKPGGPMMRAAIKYPEPETSPFGGETVGSRAAHIKGEKEQARRERRRKHRAPFTPPKEVA